MAEKRAPGRPRTYPGTEKRPTMTFRMRDAMHAQLVEAAAVSQRSLSEEIEYRLGQSFSEDRMRVIARQEMQAAIAADREPQRTELMKRAVSDGRGGWMASNNHVLQYPAETAPERTAGYVREAMKDPAVKAAMHQRYELNGK